MKKESVNANFRENLWHFRKEREIENSKNDPPQIVLSIKESVHQLRKLLEERRAREAEGFPVSPTFPLSFNFKSIMELSRNVRHKFANHTKTVPDEPVSEIHVAEAKTLHQEHEMLSMKDVAHSNGHANGYHKRTMDHQPSVVHNPEEVRQISTLIKEYRQNDMELQQAKSEIIKLQEQIVTLQEARAMLEKEKARLTKLGSPSESETKRISEQAGQSSSSAIQRNKSKPPKHRISLWRRVKKTSGRVGFGLLESMF